MGTAPAAPGLANPSSCNARAAKEPPARYEPVRQAAKTKRARPDSNGGPAGSKPEEPIHSAHLCPSQAREILNAGR